LKYYEPGYLISFIMYNHGFQSMILRTYSISDGRKSASWTE
jgi:hypothetical protein